MTRPFLAMCAGLICALLGMRQARQIREDHARLTRWQAILAQLCLLLRQGALPLHEALLAAAGGASAADHLLQEAALRMQRHPLTPPEQLIPADAPESGVLLRMLPRLYRGSLEERVLAVQQAGEEMALMAASTMDKTRLDARMWTTLGWTCGACLTLLLL